MLDRHDVRHVADRWSASSASGVVATAHYLATAAGVRALEQGGNAIDAAVTAALALGVCEPASSGLGGMAIVLVRLAESGRTFAVSGACRAPARATPEALGTSRRYNRGYRAVGTPTNVAVLHHLLSRYGRLAPNAVLQPAIDLAEGGCPITRLQHQLTTEFVKPIRKRSAAQFLLDGDGQPWPVGSRLQQPTLARTLRRLATDGFEDFYLGGVAADICEDMAAHGGFVDAQDLADALASEETAPLASAFWGDEVVTPGPPAGGLTLLHILRMSSFLDPQELALDTGDGVARVAAIIARARQDRRRYRLRTGADHVGEAAELLDERHARDALQDALRPVPVDPGIGPSGDLGAGGETTHVSVMDGEGNVVALTQSIERNFGAAVASAGLGFLYNGYLRTFKVKNQRHPYYMRPGAPARSNAAPTLVMRDGRPVACLGSTGSERMASSLFEGLLRLRDEAPFDAVHGPRLHSTPERLVMWEEERFPAECRQRLVRDGFTIENLGAYSFRMGGLQLVMRQGDQFVGVADPRRDGAAGGPRTA